MIAGHLYITTVREFFGRSPGLLERHDWRSAGWAIRAGRVKQQRWLAYASDVFVPILLFGFVHSFRDVFRSRPRTHRAVFAYLSISAKVAFNSRVPPLVKER